jgi:hypothetical protein
MRIEELEDSRPPELLINGVVDYAIYTIDLEGTSSVTTRAPSA